MVDSAELDCSTLSRFSDVTNDEDPRVPRFTYNLEGAGLKLLRENAQLDELKGSGDPISQLKAIMLWLHETIRYDGHTKSSPNMDALSLLSYASQEGQGLNCRMMATILVESYLALGFPARIVSLHGISPYDRDNHVVALVWPELGGKWVLMDPSLGQYYRDDEGRFLDPWELRTRLAGNRPVYSRDGGKERLVTPKLKKYMAKNLFYMHSPVINGFGCERLSGQKWIVLYPKGFDVDQREGLHLEWWRRTAPATGQWNDTLEKHYQLRRSRLERGAFIYTNSGPTFFKAPQQG